MPDREPVVERQGPARIVVLASGGGTNCQALIDACVSDVLDAEIVAVITNNPDARVLERAHAGGITSHVIEHAGRDAGLRRQADQRLIELVSSCDPDLVVLAGWMRILGAEVGAAFPMMNLHPGKPGEFPGIRAIDRAYDAWTNGEISESGVMIHWVPDDGVDVGPVIVTESVPFVAGDSLGDFEARMHAMEHQLIVAGVAQALAELSRSHPFR